ncbi:TetR/AcrR family transcriptional regulator [Streptosporangium sp. G11]|uniref:TetR/AcrR family transcriptional regulator n=1 Tax=Streptosporangium sp. G11 TaxID=3436926 RepID=UPI003EC06A0A
MRVSRQQAAANRERVLESAAGLLRAHGLDGVSIADIMSAAGLTHGGFYFQFASKKALVEEACARGVRESVAAIHGSAAGPPGAVADGGDQRADRPAPLRRVLDDYLSGHRRDVPQDGCTVAALSADAGRGSPELQDVFATGITGMARALGQAAGAVPVDGDPAPPDYPLLAAIVGAMILSRAVRASDPALSDRILSETRERLAEG